MYTDCSSESEFFQTIIPGIPAKKVPVPKPMNAYQNYPRNLATAMWVSIDTTVQRCEVRKVTKTLSTVQRMHRH